MSTDNTAVHLLAGGYGYFSRPTLFVVILNLLTVNLDCSRFSFESSRLFGKINTLASAQLN